MRPTSLPCGQWFAAPWSWSLRVVTALATTLLLGAAGTLCRTAAPDASLVHWMSPIAALLILSLAALFAVRAYRIDGRVLIIQRSGWQSRISLQGLTKAHADPKAMAASLRVFGNGGLFAFTGWYVNRPLGRYRAYATDPSRAVVLSFKDRRVVVTPDEPEAFVRALDLRLRQRAA